MLGISMPIGPSPRFRTSLAARATLAAALLIGRPAPALGIRACYRGWVTLVRGRAVREQLRARYAEMPPELVEPWVALRLFHTRDDARRWTHAVAAWLGKKGIKISKSDPWTDSRVVIVPDPNAPSWLGRVAANLQRKGATLGFSAENALVGGAFYETATHFVSLPMEDLFGAALSPAGGHEIKHFAQHRRNERNELDVAPQLSAIYRIALPGHEAGDYQVLRVDDRELELKSIATGERTAVPRDLFLASPHQAIRLGGREFFAGNGSPQLELKGGIRYGGSASHLIEEGTLTYPYSVQRGLDALRDRVARDHATGDPRAIADTTRALTRLREESSQWLALVDSDTALLTEALGATDWKIDRSYSADGLDRYFFFGNGRRLRYSSNQVQYREVFEKHRDPHTDWSADPAALREILGEAKTELEAQRQRATDAQAEIDRLLAQSLLDTRRSLSDSMLK
jgi:hypothetical protein